MMPDRVAPFIAARDLLLRLRTDYGAAVREFRWPVMDRFNWALDFFDHLPADDLALWRSRDGPSVAPRCASAGYRITTRKDGPA